ncbi:MAG: hypothetical protein U0872_11990 [Planctomycetaceae bacterium]
MKRYLLLLFLCGVPTAAGNAADELYATPRADDVRSKVLIWVAEQPGGGAEQKAALQQLWAEDEHAIDREELLDRVIDSFALFDARIAELAEACRRGSLTEPVPGVDFVKDIQDPFVRANVRLFAGERLVERLLFDEADAALADVDPRQVVDPPALFFHRAVAAQGLLEISSALEALKALQERTEDVLLRYATTAALMQAELQNLQEKSLGEVARMMSDSERRLDLGRAGEKVQGVQERIIANLDELIKKWRSNPAGSGRSRSRNSNQSDSPAQDSSVSKRDGARKYRSKQLSKQGRWGICPTKNKPKPRT